jgi:hypothetical protein
LNYYELLRRANERRRGMGRGAQITMLFKIGEDEMEI